MEGHTSHTYQFVTAYKNLVSSSSSDSNEDVEEASWPRLKIVETRNEVLDLRNVTPFTLPKLTDELLMKQKALLLKARKRTKCLLDAKNFQAATEMIAERIIIKDAEIKKETTRQSGSGLRLISANNLNRIIARKIIDNDENFTKFSNASRRKGKPAEIPDILMGKGPQREVVECEEVNKEMDAGKRRRDKQRQLHVQAKKIVENTKFSEFPNIQNAGKLPKRPRSRRRSKEEEEIAQFGQLNVQEFRRRYKIKPHSRKSGITKSYIKNESSEGSSSNSDSLGDIKKRVQYQNHHVQTDSSESEPPKKHKARIHKSLKTQTLSQHSTVPSVSSQSSRRSSSCPPPNLVNPNVVRFKFDSPIRRAVVDSSAQAHIKQENYLCTLTQTEGLVNKNESVQVKYLPGTKSKKIQTGVQSSVPDIPKSGRTKNRRIQSTPEYLSNSDLFCLEWINKYLFNASLHPNTYLLEEKNWAMHKDRSPNV